MTIQPDPVDPDLIGQAIRIVAEGRAYTRKNFPIGSPGKYVGHTPANEFDAAVDTVTAAATTLREENVLLSAALAEEEAELERLGFVLRTEIGDLEREVERLRGLLAEALNLLADELPSQIRRELGPGTDNDRLERSGPVAWNIACWIQEEIAPPFVERIRRQAGLA